MVQRDAIVCSPAMDVPGSELDDEREKDGNEDEENNAYSLGADEQIDHDEDNQ